jgi:hypothetical protein
MTEQNQQTQGRNDPAIDPDTPDNELGQGQQYQTEASQSQGTPQDTPQDSPTDSSPDKPQGQPQTQLDQLQESGGSTFTPDFEPEEKPDMPRSNPHPTQGEDADIATDGG